MCKRRILLQALEEEEKQVMKINNQINNINVNTNKAISEEECI